MKKTIIALAAVALAFGARAQQATEVVVVETTEDAVVNDAPSIVVKNQHDFENWFVSASAGPMVYFGDHNRQCLFKDMISPALNVSVGKFFTPIWGARITYSGLSVRGATQGSHSTGEPLPNRPWHGYWLYKQKFPFFNIHADAMLHLHNDVYGYQPGRVWNSIVWLGVGVARVWESPTSTNVTWNGGWINNFRLCSFLDATVELHGMLVRDHFSGDTGGRRMEGLLSLTAGLNFRF